MPTRTHSTVPAVATLLAFLMSSVTPTAIAQSSPRPPAKVPQHQEGMSDMKGMKGMHEMPDMNGMKRGPHHVLAMAYRDNLATFARALHGQVARSKSVALDLARPAVGEMRRSFDQMQQHHQAEKTMMGEPMKSSMAETMQHMETHLTGLNERLLALESAVNAGTPEGKAVSEHLTEILKQCAGMSAMPAKAKPHQMK